MTKVLTSISLGILGNFLSKCTSFVLGNFVDYDGLSLLIFFWYQSDLAVVRGSFLDELEFILPIFDKARIVVDCDSNGRHPLRLTLSFLSPIPIIIFIQPLFRILFEFLEPKTDENAFIIRQGLNDDIEGGLLERELVDDCLPVAVI